MLSQTRQASALQDLSSGLATLAHDNAKTGQQGVCNLLPIGLHVIKDVSSSRALRVLPSAMLFIDKHVQLV